MKTKSLTFTFLVLFLIPPGFSQELKWFSTSENTQVGNPTRGGLEEGASGNLYFGITTLGATTFFGESYTSPTNYYSAHLYKITPNGSRVWRVPVSDQAGSAILTGSTIDQDENMFAVGRFLDSLTVGTTKLASTDSATNAYFLKLNSDGDLQFIKTFSAKWVNLTSVKTDLVGNVYVIGEFEKSVRIEDTILHSGRSNQLSGEYYYRNYFLIKYSNSGEFQFVKEFAGGETGSSSGEMVEVAISSLGNIHLLGQFRDSLNVSGEMKYSSGNQDIVLIKMNSSGVIEWIQQDQGVQGSQAYDINIDSEGNTLIVGSYNSETSFGEHTLYQTGGYKGGFLVKYSPTGEALWAKSVVAPGYLSSSIEVEVSSAGDVYWTGFYAPDAVIDNYLLAGDGNLSHNQNIFVAKVSSSGVVENVQSFTTELYANPTEMVLGAGDSLVLYGQYQGDLTYNNQTIVSQTSVSNETFLLKLSPFSTVITNKVTQEQPASIPMYPNPTDSWFDINSLKVGEVAMINSIGEVVLRQTVSNSKNRIDCSELQAGIYSVILNGQINLGKIIIQ